mgnify:CR=1 FL=1
MAPKQADIYALSRERHLDHALADAGLTAASIDVALATLLHLAGDGSARSGRRRTGTRKATATSKATATRKATTRS